MPTLENDSLVFRFPKTDGEAEFSIDLQRTLRIPDTKGDYPLPPGLGTFPLRHVKDYPRLPAATKARGGVMLPIWQAEALWLNFSRGRWLAPDLPVAIKVAAGKINAVTGEPWRGGLHRHPQDYVVSPEQPWLDGFAVEEGVVRQFVAMPLGEGYSVEEQLTGEAEWGGLQISVTPLRREVWERPREQQVGAAQGLAYCSAEPAMGLGAGGLMRQAIHEDPYDLEDWDMRATERVFVTLVHASEWKSLTGEPAPTHPPSAEEYARSGLPWFEHFARDQKSLSGSETLAKVKSVGETFEAKTGLPLPKSEDVAIGTPTPLGPGLQSARPVHSWGTW